MPGPMKAKQTVSDEQLAEFIGIIGGSCVLKSDVDYDDARSVWNLSIDKSPQIIVRCKGVADVIRCVNFAQENKLLVAVRGGGHNVAGNSTCDGGMVIDLGSMKAVRTDVPNKRVRVEGGATIRDVDRETLMFGLAVPLGIVSETGIAGLTLCGGHNWLNRLHGFACDNLILVDLITAKGEFVTASEDQNPDLFWAIRGGGGNFGIVVSFEFKAHAVGPMITFAGPFYPADDAARIMRAWRDHIKNAPDAYTSNFLFWTIPHHPGFPEELHGRDVVIPSGVYCGPAAEGEAFTKPLLELGTPLLDLSGQIPYEGIQQAFDPFFTSQDKRYNYWKSLYMDGLTDAVIGKIVDRAKNRPDPWTLLAIRHMGGAAGRISSDASALGGRDANFMLSIDTSWTDPTKEQDAIVWTRNFWTEMKEGTKGSAYLNFMSDDDDHDALMRASYGTLGYDRLKAAKSSYDPDNFFSLNQNISPD